MIIFKHKSALQKYLREHQNAGQLIGFAPTMGALHEGHLALVQASVKENHLTVVSIFVNPTQFNDPKDLEKYPVTLEQDIYLLEKAGCNILFLPAVEEIYPPAENKEEHYDLGYLETVLEGKFRPGHFQGVCKVMNRLLQLVAPDNLYMGQKDYQQCMVIKKLLALKGFTAQLHICPTLREKDGLALSSRNLRLTPDQKDKALTIYRTLLLLKDSLFKKPFADVKTQALHLLHEAGFEKIDYVEIARADNLSLLQNWQENTPIVALIAAYMGEMRLIDNMILTND
jgi:pantoate--beta-alanine ligase